MPQVLVELPAPERESLIRAGLYEATRARRRELETRLAEAQAHLQHFEQQYGVAFEQFETELLPTLDTPQTHEDYLDWFFWHTLWAEQRAQLTALQA
ncbi:MAG: hypothetical protein R3C14_23990 [Caldilineaceae bacterium]